MVLRNNLNKIVGITSLIFIILFVSTSSLKAATFYQIGESCSPLNRYIPSSCPKNYKPDLNCTANKFANPSDQCCPNFCPSDVNSDKITELSSIYRKLVIFGTEYRFSPESTPGVIKLIIQSILGFVSLYTLIRGVYLAGFKRTIATTPDEIGKINKELTNMVIGFSMCWGFILILQFVSSFLGLGSLTTLNSSADPGSSVVIVK